MALNPTTRRFVFWTVIGLGALALLVLALMPKPLPADIVPITRGPLVVTLDEEGETRVRHRYSISAPTAGRVLRIDLEPGDPVTAGETVLAAFRPSDPAPLDARSRREAEAQVRSAESLQAQALAELERARAERRFDDSELERIERLAGDGIVSQEALDLAELGARSAAEGEAAADHAARSARYDLERARAALYEAEDLSRASSDQVVRMRSPIDGVVLRRLRESESVVPAGEPLLEIADPADLEIVADYLSTDAVRMRPGQRVILEQWGGDAPLAGRVRRIEPAGFTKISALGVEEQRVNVIIDFDDPQSDLGRLGDGYRLETRVVVWEGQDLLKVPASSLFRHEEGWAVFAVEGGKARLTPVEPGARNGLEAEIRSGLDDGAEVVSHPGDGITDGVAVESAAH